MNFSGARVAADSFPIWFCATWINPFSSSGVGMEEPDPGWEWAAVIWGRGGGMQGEGRAGAQLGSLLCSPRANSNLLPAPEVLVLQPEQA